MHIKMSWSILIDMDFMEEHPTPNQITNRPSMNPIMEDFLVRQTPILRDEKGQSALEFILTFAFALGVTFLFINQSLNLTAGYLNHYVNFMASRAYLVHDAGNNVYENNINYARDRAQEVFRRFPLKELGIDADFQVVTRNEGSALFSGTTSTFKKSLSSLPIIGGGEKATLLSESFLGKEPLRFTCFQMICAAMTGNTQKCQTTSNLDIVPYDNGC